MYLWASFSIKKRQCTLTLQKCGLWRFKTPLCWAHQALLWSIRVPVTGYCIFQWTSTLRGPFTSVLLLLSVSKIFFVQFPLFLPFENFLLSLHLVYAAAAVTRVQRFSWMRDLSTTTSKNMVSMLRFLKSDVFWRITLKKSAKQRCPDPLNSTEETRKPMLVICAFVVKLSQEERTMHFGTAKKLVAISPNWSRLSSSSSVVVNTWQRHKSLLFSMLHLASHNNLIIVRQEPFCYPKGAGF